MSLLIAELRCRSTAALAEDLVGAAALAVLLVVALHLPLIV